jgi:F-type H+-transporting ATPase subunit delta
MADMKHIARPYANAVFKFSKGHELIADWSEILSKLTYLISDQAVLKIVNDPQVDRNIIVDVFQGLLGDIANANTYNFLLCLAEHNRFLALQEIFDIYEALRLQEENKVDVLITSSSKLSADILEKMKNNLVKRFDSKINVECDIDESIIGGAVIKVGDLVIDGSVKGKLDRLKHALLAE